jgi:localization factor PodJL
MRFGLPWRVEGIRYEARETAEAAARRAGLPLNEWLNAVIMQQAGRQESRAQPHSAAHSDDRADDFSRVQLRLDDLTRRIEHLAGTGPAAYAPKRNLYDTGQIADQVERLEQRIREVASHRPELAPQGAQLPPTLDRVMDELTSHRGEPSGEEMSLRAPGAPFRLDGLEEKLRHITEQIETLKRPALEEAIRTLRAELGDIGRALNEALPRHAIETLEMQIQVLAQRIAEGREAGVDSGALIGIENGLAEVRDALRDLMPAENLVGYNEAIKSLTQKIDLIVADRNPATMQQLERSLTTLREMSAHVASNDTVSRLSAQVQTLAEKIDRLAIGPRSEAKLDNLASRIDALTRVLAERTQVEFAAPQRLEELIQSLSEKIEQLQKSGAGNIAADHLENRIVKLMERMDASDSRLDKLDAIERGLADLLVHIEELRANRKSTAIRAEGPGIDSLTQDIVYTRKSLDAAHRRLGDLFDRLAIIETGIRGSEAHKPATPKLETTQGDNFQFTSPANLVSPELPIAAESPIETSIVPEMPAPANPLLPEAAPLPIPAAFPVSSRIEPPARVAIELPPDQPLEPGSGPPRRAPPSLRIAASEAALGGARPAAGASASKASFIAAARRAAQAAGQEQGGRLSRADIRNAPDEATPPMRSRVATRVKSALLAASIVAIIAGSFQLLGSIFDFSIFDTIESKLAANIDSDAIGTDAEEGDAASVAAIPNDDPALPGTVDAATPAAPRSADVTASLLSPHSLPNLTPAPPFGIQPVPQQAVPSLLAPALSVPGPVAAAPGGDVTGSVAHAPAKQAASAQQPAADRLPANIGSPRLRTAALGGDAGAAYEVAMRFVEGRGVPANLEEGAHWFERAARKGLTPAQFRYATMLEKGQGVKKDLAAAQKLYIAAASKGHAKAMHNLAVLYAEGAEGKPDYASAAQWFRKAAEHGVADSQYNFGVLAARGLGTEQNIAESYKWFALAAAQGDKEAIRKRDDVAAQLDAQTLASVQQAVKSFTPTPQPAEAIQITAPPGGWDRVTQSAQEKQRAAGPVSIGAFESGKL